MVENTWTKEAAIEAKVIELVIQSLGIEPDLAATVTLNSFFVEDLGADSFGIITLLAAIDAEYGLEIPQEDVETLKTVNDVVEYIKARVKS